MYNPRWPPQNPKNQLVSIYLKPDKIQTSIARSLFAPVGTLLPCNGKYKLMEELENSAINDEEEIYPVEGGQRAVIIDAMALVQQLGSNDTVSCKILANNINQWLCKYVKSHQSVHMVFDHYDVPVSLKQQTRERRTKNTKTGVGKSHICTDATPIRTTFKQFMAISKTKDSLTDYLANKILDHFKSHDTEVIVSTHRGARPNQGNVDHLSSTQEEAETFALHALHAVRSGAEVQILSPDSDVLLLALRRYPVLGHNPSFVTGSARNGYPGTRFNTRNPCTRLLPGYPGSSTYPNLNFFFYFSVVTMYGSVNFLAYLLYFLSVT
jgi:hypothetical protein